MLSILCDNCVIIKLSITHAYRCGRRRRGREWVVDVIRYYHRRNQRQKYIWSKDIFCDRCSGNGYRKYSTVFRFKATFGIKVLTEIVCANVK